MLKNAPILLLDEATSALDPETTQSILRLLLEINQKLGLTIALITHEMQVIRTICDRVAVIEAGEIVETGPVVDVFLHPQHPVTQALVAENQALDLSLLRQMQAKRDAEFKADNERRKQLWREQIDPQPVAKKQQKRKNKLQSNQEVTVDTPSQLAAIDAYIANLERQKQDLYQAVVVRQAKLRLEEELRVLEAKRQQELDDEEALLALIL